MKLTEEDLENETWLGVKNWETIYEVSDLGRVRRIPFYGLTKTGKKHLYRGGMLKQEVRGKCYITFRQEDTEERYCITELVYNTFNPENKLTEFKWLDQDCKNNRLANINVLEEGFKQCKICLEDKNIENFYTFDNKISTYCKKCTILKSADNQKINSESRKNYLRKYSINNKERLLKNKRVYREQNKEFLKEYMKNYQVARRANDKLIRVKHNVRNRLWHAFKSRNWKKDGSVKLLGADYEVVTDHLESLFLENMSWDNYGRCVDGNCNNYWHIDHKIPLNTATTQEELETLCHYTNLQPLWAIDNLSKPKF